MKPTLATADYIVIGGYMVFALLVGVLLSRKASESSENYFLGGRNLPWWLVGISMAATCYASDTPLAVTEMIRHVGIQRLWWFLSGCIGLSLGIFVFSRLWRRAEITTDAELYELRYSGKAATALRAFTAGYTGIVRNVIIMGWVILAMSSILQVLTDTNQWVAIGVCVIVALTYAVFSGFYGVVVTDFVQFFIAVGAMIYLAVLSWSQVGGLEVIAAKVAASPGYGEATFNFFPDFSQFNSDIGALLVFVLVLWWGDSGGYKMQRISSCKNEKHSVLAMLFFAIFQTCRAWIWVGVAVVSIVLFPDLSHMESGDTSAYPMVMNFYLPAGIKGLLITAFLAAFMSTIDTHLNWGASYIMTDVYRRFIKPEATEAHYMFVTKLAVIGLMVIATALVPLMSSVTAAWQFLALLQAGVGIIAVLRWMWWRITAYTELSVYLGSGALAVVNAILVATNPSFEVLGTPWNEWAFEFKLTLFIAIVLPLSLVVTLMTPPDPKESLERFYLKVRPGGFWGGISEEVRQQPDRAITKRTIIDFFAGLMMSFGLSLAIGYFLFGQPLNAAICLAFGAIGGAWVYRWYKRETAHIQL